MRKFIFLHYHLTIYFSKPQSCLSLRTSGRFEYHFKIGVCATSEAIEAEVLLKVWDVLHPRAVGEEEGASVASGGGVGERSEWWGWLSPSEARLPLVGLTSSCRRRQIASAVNKTLLEKLFFFGVALTI